MSRRSVRLAGLLLLVSVVSALLYYKWGASLRVLDTTRASGKLGVSADAVVHGGVVSTTLAYFHKIWPALTYGIVIGSMVPAALPAAWVARRLGAGAIRPTLTAALVGAPLMLCSCCVTPIFTGVHQRGGRLGPALSLMLASPGLNPAALVLTFALMPVRLGIGRALGAAVIVLLLAPLLGRALERTYRPTTGDGACPLPEEPPPMTFRAFGRRLLESVVSMVRGTVPLIVAGVLLSGLLLPHVVALGHMGSAAAIVVVALLGVLVALPTFVEVPIALVLMNVDPSGGASVAFMIAGPIVNLPSLLVLGRESHPKIAGWLAGGVWAVATLAGMAVSR
jgi:uncharacterized membrane protein YraQ (UPF0718 family)